MAEKIGLEAILTTTAWDKGVRGYLDSLDKMNKETGAFDKSTANFGTKAAASFQNLGKVVAGAGIAIAAAGAAAGVAIGKFVADGIGKAADLESQLSSIAATLNMTKEQVGPLNDLILNLGLDPNLKVSATEAADAIESLAKNGLSMTQIIDGAARSTVLLANATGADFGMAADIASDTMALFNIKAEDMAKAVDQITGVTNASKFTIDDYRLAIAQAGGVAALVGVTFEDFNTTIAAISPRFASGSDAGTSFKTMLMSLIPSTTAAEEVFAELELVTFNTEKAMELLSRNGIKPLTNDYGGIHRALQQYFESTFKVSMATQEGIDKFGKWTMEIGLMQNAFFDVNGEMKGMADVSEILNEATKDLTEEQRIMAFETMFGSDAIRAASGVAASGVVMYESAAEAAKVLGVSIEDASALAEGGITKFEAMQLQIGKIDASEQAATRMNNFKGALEILQGAIETLQIQIGQAFLPMLQELAQRATELVSAFGPVLMDVFEKFSGALTNMFAAIDAGKAPLDVFMAFMIGFGPQGVAVASSMSEIALSIGAVVGAIGMALQPITDAIARFVEWQDVLIVLGAALAMVVVPAIAGIVAAMAPVILTFAAATLIVAGLRTAWENDFLGIQTATTAAIAVVQENIGPLLTTLSDLSDRVLPLLKEHWDELAVGVAAFGAVMLAAQIPTIIGGISAAVAAAGPAIVTALAAINLPLIAIAVAVAGLAAAWQGNWFGIRDTTAQVVAAIQEKLAPFTTAVQTHMQGALAEVKAFATGNATEWTNTKAIWEGAKTSASDIFTSIVSLVTNNLPTWKAKLTEWGVAAGEWLITAAAEVSTKLGEWYTSLSGALADNLPAWTAAFEDWITAAWEWIQEASTETAAQIGTWYTELSGAVAANLPAWKKSFDDWIKGLYEWIKESLPKVTTEIDGWYTKLSSDVAAKLPTFTVEMLKWATALVEWISDKAADALPHLGTWLGKIIAWIPTGIVLLTAQMLKMATALVEWIGSAAADALPHLGTWMGKIVAWIPLGVAALVVGVVKLASALIGWINGGGGVQVSDSATGQVSTEFAKFTTALGNGITAVWNGFKGFVQNFAQSFWDEISKHVDWTQLGMDIVGFIQSGVESVTATLIGTFENIANDAAAKLIEFINWLGLGEEVVTLINDGVSGLASMLIDQFTTMAEDAFDAFLEIDWIQLGKNVIDGILEGLKDNGSAIVDYIVGLGQQALDQIKEFFGIKSPSRVMMEVGYDIVRGLIKGIDEQQNRLKQSVGRMMSNVLNTLVHGAERATDVLSSLAGSFSSAGGGFAGSLQQTIESFTQHLDNMSKWAKPLDNLSFYVNRISSMQGSVARYEGQKRSLDILKQQADLINLIRESGGNPSEVLAGVTLGVGADPQQLLDVVTRTMQTLNNRLATSLNAAASGLPELVEKLRANRKSIEDIEADFAATHLNQREQYAANLAAIDERITRAEQDLLTTGNKNLKNTISQLDIDRNRITLAIDTYMKQVQRLDYWTGQLRALTGPGQESATRFVQEQIQSIADGFSGIVPTGMRESWLKLLEERVNFVNRFGSQMQQLEPLFRRIASNSAFGHLVDEIAAIQDIMLPEATRTSLISSVRTYVDQIERFQALQQDLSTGASPFVEQFKNARLDTIEQQLENINLSEAERARLIEQYRMEQEKILAIQQKQSQLDFLKQQLDLLNQVKDLDDKFGELVPVSDIFAGVQFGVNASLDSLMGAVSKAIDAMIRVTNKELGIASPSKVFEKIGQYMMGGLARGIETSVMRPISSLSGAISELPYALGGRSLTLNMGGVSISNGMDEVLFEARVRQILDRAFP